ncbi:MAG: hypothetical protein E7441_00880 [Ruminococcaceae bacterium]|nr:hypothetical protein [Oscillospiraceae bacterium]
MGRDKKLTDQEYKELFDKYKNDVLLENESARQMINHRSHLFITDRGRVLSVGTKGIKIMKQSLRAQTYSNDSEGLNEKKHCICINISGKNRVYAVHRLVGEYFSDKITAFVTDNNKPTVIHHIKSYNPDSEDNNAVGNLLRINQNVHALLHRFAKLETLTEREECAKKLELAINGRKCDIFLSLNGDMIGLIPINNGVETTTQSATEYLKQKGII